MLSIVTVKNRHRFARECESMHRDRKRVFIDRLQWNLEAKGALEIDQFDTDAAVYILEASGHRHLASLRLLPTTGPHLLSEVFPHLCDGDIPRGEDIWELTRLCINPDVAKDEARRLRGIVWLGALEFAVAHGIRQFTGVTHAQFLAQVLAAGLDVEPLGLPQNHGGSMIGAHIVHIALADIHREREQLGGAQRNGAAIPQDAMG